MSVIKSGIGGAILGAALPVIGWVGAVGAVIAVVVLKMKSSDDDCESSDDSICNF